jgi:hypothetical protein
MPHSTAPWDGVWMRRAETLNHFRFKGGSEVDGSAANLGVGGQILAPTTSGGQVFISRRIDIASERTIAA